MSIQIKKIIIFIILFIVFSFVVNSTYAQSSILINEFSPASSSEWVELYNNSPEKISLEGITLFFDDDLTTSQKLSFCSTDYLEANSYLLINSKGSWLSNTADTLILNKNNDTIDSVTYGATTPLKAPKDGESATRMPDGSSNWIVIDSPTSQGKYAVFECPVLTPTPSPTPTKIATPVPTATPTAEPSQKYENIFISEAIVAPNTGEKEWVELYNDNDFEAKLVDWYIDDIEDGGSKPKKFTLNIPAQSYKTVILPNGFFNNSGDSVRLMDFEEQEKGNFSYTSSKKGLSWGWTKIKDTNFCEQYPTPDNENSGCVATTSSNTSSTQSSETAKSSSTPIMYSTTNTSIGQSSQVATSIRGRYRILVSPPIIANTDNHISSNQVLGASISQNTKTSQKKLDLQFLAGVYSLLSAGSITAKIILSQLK